MNIGIVTTWFERGAAYVSKQFEEVLANEHSVFIYARGGEFQARGDKKWDKENVTWAKVVGSPINSTVIDKSDFHNWIKRNNIEIIIFNEQRWFYPVLWCKEWNVGAIAYIDYYTSKTLPLFEAYDFLICNTQRHYEAFLWHPGARYVAWGTDISLFQPRNKENALVNKDFVTFFHSAGMNPIRKGTDQLLEALLRIDEKIPLKVIIHTQVSLDSFFPNLSDKIDSLIKKGKLEIIERTVSAPGLYHLGDVYVYPARLDGLGLTMAEAISSGLALVVPDNAPMNEFCVPDMGRLISVNKYFSRSDGYYWPQCEIDINSLSNIMKELAISRSEVLNMKINARLSAMDKLNWEVNSLELLKVVNESGKSSSVLRNPELFKKIRQYENDSINYFNSLYVKAYPWSRYLYKFLKKIRS